MTYWEAFSEVASVLLVVMIAVMLIASIQIIMINFFGVHGGSLIAMGVVALLFLFGMPLLFMS